MNMQQLLEYFRQLPAGTQIVVIVFALIIIVVVAVFPTAGTNMITFLLGLKMLLGR